MTDTELLEMLKVDLGISATAYDERLAQYIETAKEEIVREGATLDMSKTSHCSTVLMYAAWLWRNRDSQTGMPRMVRYACNNLVLSQKMSGGES